MYVRTLLSQNFPNGGIHRSQKKASDGWGIRRDFSFRGITFYSEVFYSVIYQTNKSVRTHNPAISVSAGWHPADGFGPSSLLKKRISRKHCKFIILHFTTNDKAIPSICFFWNINIKVNIIYENHS